MKNHNKIWKNIKNLRGSLSSQEFQFMIISLIFFCYKNYNNSFVKEIKKNKNDIGFLLNKISAEKKITYNNFENLNNEVLFELIKLLFELISVFKRETSDVLGRIYELFSNEFSTQKKSARGEFFTPKSIVKLMIGLLKPKNYCKIYDPACGTGGILLELKKVESSDEKNEFEIYGQEINELSWKIAKLNFEIFNIREKYDIYFALGEKPACTFKNDQHPNHKFTHIFANPPFNLTMNWYDEKLKKDVRFLDLPSQVNANYAWLLHIYYKLNKNGTAIILMPINILTSNNTKERELRETFLNKNVIDAIIQLPRKLFYSTNIPTVLIIMKKNRPNVRKDILMISTRNFKCKFLTRTLVELKEEEITKICNTYEKYQKIYGLKNIELKNNIDKLEYAKVVNYQEIKEKNFSWKPDWYVESKHEKNNFVQEKSERISEIKKLTELIIKMNRQKKVLQKKIEEFFKKEKSKK